MDPKTCLTCSAPAVFAIDAHRNDGDVACAQHIGDLLLVECPDGCQVNVTRA